MKRLVVASLAALTLAFGFGPAEAAATHVQVGRLSCEVQGGVGYLIGSSKDMTCWFQRDGFRPERYRGNISKIGFDLGVTDHTHIEWLVFAATNSYRPHALAGNYVGGSSEATFGVGLGANWLVGGSHRSFALQPISVQAQTGFDLSLALAGLTLR